MGQMTHFAPGGDIRNGDIGVPWGGQQEGRSHKSHTPGDPDGVGGFSVKPNARGKLHTLAGLLNGHGSFVVAKINAGGKLHS